MHHRGTTRIGGTFTRASVWIEQEIAIAAFMGQILNRPLPTVSYYEQGIQLEGVRQFILLNPKQFITSDDVLKNLETVLPTLGNATVRQSDTSSERRSQTENQRHAY
jgi:hypothetical protein